MSWPVPLCASQSALTTLHCILALWLMAGATPVTSGGGEDRTVPTTLRMFDNSEDSLHFVHSTEGVLVIVMRGWEV